MNALDQYATELDRHYEAAWGGCCCRRTWTKGPARNGPPFVQRPHVLEYDCTFTWVYATAGMTPLTNSDLLELFLLSPRPDERLIELLTVVTHYHQTGAALGLGHTVNFGVPCLDDSACTYGLISLPYRFGPPLENAMIAGKKIRVLWLIPITFEERAYKIAAGLDALEDLFEHQQFDYLDPKRPSVVANR